MARTAWIVERAGRKYGRIFEESKQRRGYEFSACEWWATVAVDGVDVSDITARACPKNGWVDVYVIDADGAVRHSGAKILKARITGTVTVANARRYGGISHTAAVDG